MHVWVRIAIPTCVPVSYWEHDIFSKHPKHHLVFPAFAIDDSVFRLEMTFDATPSNGVQVGVRPRHASRRRLSVGRGNGFHYRLGLRRVVSAAARPDGALHRAAGGVRVQGVHAGNHEPQIHHKDAGATLLRGLEHAARNHDHALPWFLTPSASHRIPLPMGIASKRPYLRA